MSVLVSLRVPCLLIHPLLVLIPRLILFLVKVPAVPMPLPVPLPSPSGLPRGTAEV
jgi:hypothetical protein